MRLNRRSAVLASLLIAFSPTSPAEAWPAKPIRTVVPVSAGGGADILACDVTSKPNSSATWSWVADNKPSSGSNLDCSTVARLATDMFQREAGIQLTRVPFQEASLGLTNEACIKMGLGAAHNVLAQPAAA